MDRRDFLKQVLAGGAVGAGTLAGCATTGTRGAGAVGADGPPPSVDMDAYVAKLDSIVGAIHRENYFADLVAAANPGAAHDPDDLARRENLARKALSTLTLTGMFMDLNEEDRQHPAIQARLWGALSDMNDSVWNVHDMLASMPQGARDQMRSRLRAEPDLVDRVADALDAKSAVIELPAKRRQHLRRLMGQVGWRLREQDPSLLIDDVTDKVSRMAQRAAQTDPNAGANGGVTTMQPVQVAPQPQPGQPAQPGPPPAGQAGQPAQGQWVQNGAGQWVFVATGPAQPQPQPVGVAPAYAYPVAPAPRPRRNGRGMALTGAIALGLGVAAGVSGYILVVNGSGAWLAGAFLLTAAAVLLILGLVFGIIGLARGIGQSA